jgi:hypothetical protein
MLSIKRLAASIKMSGKRIHQCASPARWPIWLLFAAWFCANSPQSLTYELVVWTRDAQHFSHQERLKAEVAAILSGRDGGASRRVEQAPERPSAPPIPAEGVLRKIDLFAPLAIASITPQRQELKFPTQFVRAPDRARSEPLLPPPREAAAV